MTNGAFVALAPKSYFATGKTQNGGTEDKKGAKGRLLNHFF